MEYVLIKYSNDEFGKMSSIEGIRFHGIPENTADGTSQVHAFCSNEAIRLLKDSGCSVTTQANDAFIDIQLTEFYTEKLDPGKLMNIAIQFKGSYSEMTALGFESNSVLGDTAYGRIKLKDLELLIKHPGIIRIEKQKRSSVILNRSIPEIAVNGAWSRSGDTFSGWTGKGVIVGIIDTGIDITHENFKKADGTSRILSIWDQTLTPETGESSPGPVTDPVLLTPPPGDPLVAWNLNYGVVYGHDLIKDNPEKVRHRDGDKDSGHGTHVAGTAAGNGSQSGGPEECHLNYRYIGVAPEADIIIVRNWGLSGEIGTSPSGGNNLVVDAIGYILQEARKLKLPVVINISQASQFGISANGQATISRNMDRFLTNLSNDIPGNPNARSACIVVGSANYGHRHYHCRAPVPANSAEIVSLKFTLKNDAQGQNRTISILRSEPGLEVQVTSPLRGPNEEIVPQSVIEWTSTSKIDNDANGPNARVVLVIAPKQINLILSPPTGLYNLEGEWLIELRNPGAQDIMIDAFCMNVYQRDFDFFHFTGDHVNSLATLSDEGSTREVITVGGFTGSYIAAKPGDPYQPNKLCDFSSRGPTIDNLYVPVPDRVKPEITAPGWQIVSPTVPEQRHNFGDVGWLKRICCDCCQDYYSAISGTSFSAPLVTGVVALMMQLDGRKTHTEIRDALVTSATPMATGADPEDDAGWGSGKVNAVGALALLFSELPDAVPAPSPITDPGLAGDPAPAADPFPRLRELLDNFLRTPLGIDLKNLSGQLFAEVRFLINTNKRVATVWHRVKGPAWLRTGMSIGGSPDRIIPQAIEGSSLDGAVKKMKVMLGNYGSAQLKDFLQRHDDALNIIGQGNSLSEIMQLYLDREFIVAN